MDIIFQRAGPENGGAAGGAGGVRAALPEEAGGAAAGAGAQQAGGRGGGDDRGLEAAPHRVRGGAAQERGRSCYFQPLPRRSGRKRSAGKSQAPALH